MLKRRLLLLMSMLYSLSICAQYKGGINDGFSSLNVSNNNPNPIIYKGGNNDGYSFINLSNQNAGPQIYKGGNNDGFALASVVNQNAVPNIYTGGNNDGFSTVNIINQNAVPNIYKGGNNDGFSVMNVINQNAGPGIYKGGINDGFSVIKVNNQNAGPGIYKGGNNDGWSNISVANQNSNVVASVTLNLKLFIQGFYSGNGLMNNSGSGGCLYINGISPNPTDVDTVFVSAINSGTLAEVDRKAGILKTNGSVNINFDNSVLAGSSYYLKITHRSAITTWSSSPVFMNWSTLYDFTTSISQAYGNNQIESFDHKGWRFYSGDISDPILGVGHQDEVIESQDYTDMENAVSVILTGYVVQDITGDGVVESTDYAIMENNVAAIIFSVHP